MSLLLLLAVGLVWGNDDLVTTPDYVEYLKSVATWEVTDYEDSIFKGWTMDDAKHLLGKETTAQPYEALLATPKANHPSSLNWINSGCVHKVFDQGNCGSCWAVAAASVASDKCCIEHKDYGWLSPQELVSCDKDNRGCKGGLALRAFQYIHKHGLVSLQCMPYKAKDTECAKKCDNGKDWAKSHNCKCGEIIDCSGFDRLKTCLMEGPVAARMTVYKDFMSYKSGIYCRTKDSSRVGSHAIKCVGYGDETNPYVYCANSWGNGWGEKGYFRITPTNACGFFAGKGNIFTVAKCAPKK